jgi:hypothetical protein
VLNICFEEFGGLETILIVFCVQKKLAFVLLIKEQLRKLRDFIYQPRVILFKHGIMFNYFRKICKLNDFEYLFKFFTLNLIVGFKFLVPKLNTGNHVVNRMKAILVVHNWFSFGSGCGLV